MRYSTVSSGHRASGCPHPASRTPAPPHARTRTPASVRLVKWSFRRAGKDHLTNLTGWGRLAGVAALVTVKD